MFDEIEIVVHAGNGGNGAVSFRREKYVPFGGPDGGNGGDGGDVVVLADSSVTDLRVFKRNGHYKAGNGSNGRGQKKHGKKGKELILRVPLGTMVIDRTQLGKEILIGDLEHSGEREVVVKGGKGGFGNARFVSSTNQAPKIAQAGEVGQEILVGLEMRMIADVGIIGYPNAGKSTLLTNASAAKVKIASYPFTTREPALGVVVVGQRSFILAEIPGLINDAHLGRGLGHKFLRHTMRTKILVHLIDGCSVNLLDDFMSVNKELVLFDSGLGDKSQLVVVNKIDLPEVEARLTQIRDVFRGVGTDVRFISAATGEGVEGLMEEAANVLEQVGEVSRKVTRKIFRPQSREENVRVFKEGEVFVVVSNRLERFFSRIDMDSPEVRWQLDKQLTRLGVNKSLKKAGIQLGDKVRFGNLEWEWY